MYIAYGSVQDNSHHGSTKLHTDLTDAVNIMVWAAARQQGQQGHALWHIFPQAASPVICDYLKNHAGYSESGNPIHSQSIYFTPAMLDDLATRYGVRAFTIYQQPGEAIYIPAGCAHQVCTLVHRLNPPRELTIITTGKQPDGCY